MGYTLREMLRDREAARNAEYGLQSQDSGGDVGREYAGLLRSEFENYRRDFLPIRDELLASYENRDNLKRLQGEATGLVNRGFDSAEGQFRRRTAGLGVRLRPEEEASYQRQQNLGRGLSTVQALNSTSRRLRDRDAAILTGVSPSRPSSSVQNSYA